MSALLVGGLLEMGKSAIKRIWPDPADQAQHELELEKLAQDGDLAELQAHVTLLSGQMEINREEAKSGSFFVAGWRPAVGWVGALSLALVYIPKALSLTLLWMAQGIMMLNDASAIPNFDWTDFALPPYPPLNLEEILGLLGAMLGIGGMRSFDKSRKTDTRRIGK